MVGHKPNEITVNFFFVFTEDCILPKTSSELSEVTIHLHLFSKSNSAFMALSNVNFLIDDDDIPTLSVHVFCLQDVKIKERVLLQNLASVILKEGHSAFDDQSCVIDNLTLPCSHGLQLKQFCE